MRCKSIRTKLDMYCSGDTEPDLHTKIENHLRTCENCSQTLRHQKAIEALFRQLPAPPVTADFAKRVVAAARRQASLYPQATEKTQYLVRLASGLSVSMRVAAVVLLAAGMTIGFVMGRDTWWRTTTETVGNAQITQDSSAAYGLDCLTEGANGSLVRTYLTLTFEQNGG
jgi:predicted anti-sigma-YlaC factor YlaD